MTTEAFIMMITAWSIIIFFTARFFIKVLRTPANKE